MKVFLPKQGQKQVKINETTEDIVIKNWVLQIGIINIQISLTKIDQLSSFGRHSTRRLVLFYLYFNFQNINNVRYILRSNESNFSNEGMYKRIHSRYWSKENLCLVHFSGSQVHVTFSA